MAECEICGKKAVMKAKIEEAVLNVCSSCAQLGQKIEVVKERKKPALTIDVPAINPDFSRIIKNARERMQLTREQLANKINEKASSIERVEKGMRPDAALTKKLERFLKIKLVGYSEAAANIKDIKMDELTLGDVAKVRKKG